MQGPCTLVEYIAASGQSVVLDFLAELERLDALGYAKWLYTKQQIQDNGTDCVGSLWVRLPKGLGEIRWRSRKTRLRIYCCEESERRVVMLHAVKKKWDAFSNNDRKLCENRREDFQSNDYDQESRHIRYLQKSKGNP